MNALTCCRHQLDSSAAAFGELRDSSDRLSNIESLRVQLDEDGYLFLRGFLDPDQVTEARRELLDRLERKIPEPARDNPPLFTLLYTGRMIELYTRLLGGPVRHFDHTWLRPILGGSSGTPPHCDIVYMGRGTKNLHTSWTPLGAIPTELGGLMILENSHHQATLLKNYLSRDVDSYCTNRRDAERIESGEQLWQFNGVLSPNPVTLRKKLGGRWLTTDYCVGDVLIFRMATVHASLDNQTDRLRLSTDSRYQLASEPIDERWVGENPVGHGVVGKRGKIC